MSVLKIHGLSKRYGDIQALSNVDLEVGPGTITALLGPNGSGKSTLIRSVVTLQPIEIGTISLADIDVAKDPKTSREHLGYAGQDPAVDKVLTGREFLRFQAGIVHLEREQSKSRIAEVLSLFELEDIADRLIETYSGGMKRRIDLAASLLHGPKLLVLDEPSSGIDFEGRRRFWEILLRLRQGGTAMLIASHDFEEIDHLADEVLILKKGQCVAKGRPQELRERLGSHVLTASLHEHIRGEDKAKLKAVLSEFQGALLPDDPASPEVSFVVTSKESARDLADELQRRSNERGLSLFSSAVRRPTLVDVYRASLGCEKEIGDKGEHSLG